VLRRCGGILKGLCVNLVPVPRIYNRIGKRKKEVFCELAMTKKFVTRSKGMKSRPISADFGQKILFQPILCYEYG
jgi:hypothetical protein